MYIDCLNCPLRASSAFRAMSPAELVSIRETKKGERHYPARTDIMIEGDTSTGIATLFSGWAFRYKVLRDGVRQVLDFMLPGDLLGLQSPLTGKLSHSIRAITDVRICTLRESKFHDLFKAHPQLTEALMATLLMEEQRADARLLLLGRQRPTERLGYLLLEIRERLERRGEHLDGGYRLPLTYELMADAIGVSRSQLGWSLRDMSQRGWASLGAGYIRFHDATQMADACEYMPMPDPSLRTLI